MKRIVILVLILTFIIQGCASFLKSHKNTTPLTPQNIDKLNGLYGITDIHYDSVSEYSGGQIWTSLNFLKEIDRKLTKDTLRLDSLSVYKFGLKAIHPKKIEISYYKDDIKIRQRTIKTKLKKDGFLYLKNKNIGILYVPPIFGSTDLKRTRLSLDSNRNLILDVAQREYIGILLGFHFDIKTSQYRMHFKLSDK